MEYRNAKHIAGGLIDCEINHPRLGWIPFTVDARDAEAQFDVRELDARIRAAGNIAPYDGPSEADLQAAEMRQKRDGLLAASDWTQMPDAPVDQAAWAKYRQALRDVPQQPGFPGSVVWPAEPK